MDTAKLDLLIRKLMSPVNQESQPQLNALRLAMRELDAIKLNIKMHGYGLARHLAKTVPTRHIGQPTKIDIQCKPSTQADMESDWVAYWLAQLQIPMVYHRKLWEFAYALQVLWQKGMLEAGRKGIGFGCGTEPLPSLLARYGVDTVATDAPPDDDIRKQWVNTNQHSSVVDDLYHGHLVSREMFDRHVTSRHVDMRKIPSDLSGFDFCWSICALEHLGSIEHGMNFVADSLSPLKPGGLAVHTTEYNFLSEDTTIDNWATVLFLRKHFVALAERLSAQGHRVAPLSFDVGADPLDLFIDVPPYPSDWTAYQKEIWPVSTHLKLSIDGFASTCFGIVVEKSQAKSDHG